ncbi:MAG: glycosyltransferase family 2 protein [Bacteroidales bacterium]|nr:glycosyltransferase family 2 protein [Bacteroidales bacterium]
MQRNPKISVIITAYNRAHVLKRAIDSVLNQSFKDFEIIIVDDGSSDNTPVLIQEYTDTRIRYCKHEINKGVCAAKNTGLNYINGEWFTFLDSDDEMLPNAIKTMLAVPERIDNEITAVTCNCIDSSNNQFSGKGLDRDCYLDNSIILSRCSGEFWGITKTFLIQQDRFNEHIPGLEVLLWYKVNNRAKRYYIHQGLRIYHTEDSDSISKAKLTRFDWQYKIFLVLIHEESYLNALKIYALKKFQFQCFKGFIIMFIMRDLVNKKYKRYLLDSQPGIKYRIAVYATELMGPCVLRFIVGKYYRKKS